MKIGKSVWKKTILTVVIIGGLLSVIIYVKHTNELSPEFNYMTAKIDIKNGHCRLVHAVNQMPSNKEKETQAIAEKYGFQNEYILNPSAIEQEGIENYNELVEIYLAFRNGPKWQESYQAEIDAALNK